MTTASLKTNIKKQINNVEDTTVLRSIHAMLKEVLEGKASQSFLNKAQLTELDKTLADHKAGKQKYYTLEQAKEAIFKKRK